MDADFGFQMDTDIDICRRWVFTRLLHRVNDHCDITFYQRFSWWFKRPLLSAFLRQLTPAYWKRKQSFARVKLIFARNVFEAKEKAGDRLRASRVFWEVGKKIGIASIEAFGLVVGFHFLWIALMRFQFISHFQIEDSVAVNFTTTLSLIAATLLGLYFAAVSTVISNAYARVPGDIRVLIAEEQVSRVYFRVLTLFAAVPMLLLGFASHGFKIDPLNMVFVCLLGLFAVFSFITLGIRTFQFFDPTAILPFLRENFARAVIAATPSGYNWRDAAFQNYQQRQAERYLGSASNLISLAVSDEQVSGRALSDIANSLFHMLCFYSGNKSRIPPSSHWFRRRNRHKDWLLSDYNEVSIALQTGTVLRPELVPDANWVEDDIAKQLSRIIAELQKRNDTSACMSVAQSLHWYCRTAPIFGASEEALRMIQALSPKLQALSATALDAKEFDLVVHSLAIADTSCASFVEVILATARGFGRLDANLLQKQLAQIKWTDRKSVSLEGAPAPVAVELEKLASQFEFEIKVEGKIVTPAWWSVEVVAFATVLEIQKFLRDAIEQAERMFNNEAAEQFKAKRYLLVAQIVARGLEACSKCSDQFSTLEQLVDRLTKLDFSKNWEWPKIDWAEHQQKIQKLRNRLIAYLSRSSLLLDETVTDDRLPDYFGQAYSIIANECLLALFMGDKTRFDELFVKYFHIALKASERLRQRFLANDARNIWVSGDPVIDLLAISGYALLATELDGVPFKDTVVQRWEAYFQGFKKEDEQRIIELLGAFAERGTFRSPPRELIRIQWQQRWEGMLRERGLTGMHDYFMPEVQHHSLLIKLFAGRHGLERAQELFLASHIFSRPNAKGLKIPRAVNEMQDSLRRMQEDAGQNQSE
jgi:hypothetical protein